MSESASLASELSRPLKQVSLIFGPHASVRGNIWAGNQPIAEDAPESFVTTSTATQLRLVDQVGTVRGLLDLGGHITESCTSFPYGDGVVCSSSQDPEFFKRRDTESDLDYFGARYYNSTVGRFMSLDPSGLLAHNPADPQSWNLYAYARNNPLINIDPNGLDCIYPTDIWATDITDSGVREVSQSGALLSGMFAYNGGVLTNPIFLALDGSGDLWVVNESFGGNTGLGLSELIGVATPVVTPIATEVKNNTLGTRP